ncbi:MAG: rod shape-determining protein MreD [Thermodesulfovibrionales bacterium]|nr:rod shape-determining protein MreD [Thermodesulfovibrionales bacterium]
MKKPLIYGLLFVSSLIIESRVSVFGIRPDATALLAYYFGLRNGPLKGAAFGASLGAASDALSLGMLGPDMLGKAAVGYLSALLPEIFFGWTLSTGLAAAAALTLIDRTISFGAVSIFGQMPAGIGSASYIAFGQAAINSFAWLFIRYSPGEWRKHAG